MHVQVALRESVQAPMHAGLHLHHMQHIAKRHQPEHQRLAAMHALGLAPIRRQQPELLESIDPRLE